MELLERALGNIDGLSDVERVEGLVGRLELRRENLYPAIREEGGLKKKA